jgi:hypothetical protein
MASSPCNRPFDKTRIDAQAASSNMKTFLLLFVVFTTLAWADGLPTVPYLYVEGNAEVEKKADLFTLRIVLLVSR